MTVPGVSVPTVASVTAPGVVIPQLSAGLGNVAAATAQGWWNFEGKVSSKMTYIFEWPVRISIFFRKHFVIYFVKNFSRKSEV